MKSRRRFSVLFLSLLGLSLSLNAPSPITKAEEEEPAPEFKLTMVDLSANGDCSLITYGDTQILIDCGGNAGSASNIVKAIDSVFSDSDDTCLDYVIFSHGDSDHIYSFACSRYDTAIPSGTDSSSCLTCYLREKGISIGTFIDFDPSKDETLNGIMKEGLYTKEAEDENDDEDEEELKAVYNRYSNARELLLKSTSGAKIKNYFTSSECLYKQRELSADNLKLNSGNSSSVSDTFRFSSSPKGTIQILDNQYCYTKYGESNNVTALDRNILATCCLITFDGYKYLFTGDLPEFNSSYSRVGGESSLIEKNYDLLKDGVLFYKAAHHGSQSSNSDNLLNVIRPQYVGISCNAGGQYHFPKDAVISDLGLYTDKIYITSCKVAEGDEEEASTKPYHGTIVFTYDPSADPDAKLKVSYDGSRGKDSIMDDSSVLWYLDDDKKGKNGEKTNNRRFPVRAIELSSWAMGITRNSCTYVKAGHYDVLINDGQENSESYSTDNQDVLSIENKIEKLCNDHVLDCLVISTLLPISYARLIGENGLLTSYLGKSGGIAKIKTVVINPLHGLKMTEGPTIETLRSTLVAKKNAGLIGDIIGLSSSGKFQSGISAQNIALSENSYVRILNGTYNSIQADDASLNSLGINVHFSLCGTSYDYVNYGELDDQDELKIMSQDVNSIDALTIPHSGYFLPGGRGPNEAKNAYWFEKKSLYFASLLNGPFGRRNVDGKCIYPTEAFRYSRFLNKEYALFHATKLVQKGHSTLLNNSSFIDLASTHYYPITKKADAEIVRIRKFYIDANGRYFSNFALEEKKLGKARERTIVETDNDAYRNLLTRADS